MSRKYTAQKMREMADFIRGFTMDSRRGYSYIPNGLTFTVDDVTAMLRQAADDMEREEKRERKYQYGVVIGGDGIDSDYIFDSEEYARTVAGDYLQVVRRSVGEWEEVPNEAS